MSWELTREIVGPAVVLAAALMAGGLLLRWTWARSRSDDDQGYGGAGELTTKFRELHARGGLSDEEYRTIKTMLAAELRQQFGRSSRDS